MRSERIGFAVCGSFCTHEQVLEALKKLTKQYETVIPIVSEISADTDTNFAGAVGEAGEIDGPETAAGNR